MITIKQTLSLAYLLVTCLSAVPGAAQTASATPFGLQPLSQSSPMTEFKAPNALTALKLNPADPLPVEAAFNLSASRSDTSINIAFRIANAYYLYKDKIHVSVLPPAKAVIPALPKGIVQYDATFAKELETYRNGLQLALSDAAAGSNGALSIDVYSQGCADIGICYPPQRQRISFAPQQTVASIQTLAYTPFESGAAAVSGANAAKPVITTTSKVVPATAAEPSAAQSGSASSNLTPQTASTALAPVVTSPSPSPTASLNTTPTTQQTSTVVQENKAIQTLLVNRNAAWLMLGFFGFGLLLTFTPCVLPMVPIVSAIVLGSARGQPASGAPSGLAARPWQGLALSAAYVAGMVSVYTALGVVAGLAGAALSAYLQHPALISGFAILMLVLAGAQFGWYDVSPMRWFGAHTAPAHAHTGLLRYASVAGMGALSAVMVGPCITAPLAGVLGFIAQTGNVWTGALALFSLAMGMGVPLLLLGAGGARYLPTSGAWLSEMSHGFGIMLLASAIWLAQSMLPTWLSTVLWLGLVVLLAEWLGAFKPWSHQAQRLTRLKQALAYACVLWAALIIAGMAMGRFDALSPLAGILAGASRQPFSAQATTQSKPAFELVLAQDVDRALHNTAGQLVLLDIYADWCVSCIEFERFTFTDRTVAAAMTEFKLLKVDVTRNTPADQALLKKLKLFGPPAIVFYTPNGQEIDGMRVIGFQKAPVFLQHLNMVQAAAPVRNRS